METHQGILPRKRLRFWWAVVGLIALVVPYVANVGLLAKTVYAAEKTLYKSDRLTVTAGEGDGWQWQSGHDVSWKLNFVDKETAWPNWDKVTFKIDVAAAKKAGLTDFKVDGKSWDAKTGELGSFIIYDNDGGHSLNLSATSTNDKKRAVSLPIGLSLTQESTSTRAVKEVKATEASLLPDDAKMTIQANLYGYDGEEEGEEATPEQPGETNPTEPADPAADPADTYAKLANLDSAMVDGFLIERGVRTTAGSDNKTNFDNFQLWSSMDAPVFTTADDKHAEPVTIYRKADVSKVSNLGETEDENNSDRLKIVRGDYHNQYEQTGGNNQSAYTISFENGAAMKDAKFTVVYDHVGSYVDENKVHHPIGATLSISNITEATGDHLQLGNMHFIDIPNNLYSGLMYHGIESMDIKLQLYTLENGQFTKRVNVDAGDGHVTFSSLNNFGKSANSSSSVTGYPDFTWDQLSTGINNSKYAETVFGGAGTLPAQPYADSTTGVTDSFMKQDGSGVWYSTVHGVYDVTDVNNVNYGNYGNIPNNKSNFEDALGGVNFQKGALLFPVSGNTYNFTLRTGDGNTWQTISAAVMHPLDLTDTHKLVTTDDTTYATAISDAKAGQSGNLHEKNLAITSTDAGKFNFSYWVTQPTYDLGTDSLIRPFGVRFEDTLPDGVSLRDGANSVELYDTVGNKLKVADDYTVKIDGQKVSVSMTEAGIKKIDFNGDMFALHLDVAVDSQIADGLTTWSKDNTADVYTKVSDTAEEKSTSNTVNVKLKELPKTDVTINKIDEDGNALAGASFALKKVGEASAWTAASFASAEVSAYKALQQPETISATSSTDTSWTWNDLPVGQYQLVETAPNGYVGATDVTFTVGATMTANQDGTGDAYAATFEETTDPAVLKNVVTATNDQTGFGVTADVPNQLDIKALFQVKKVDQDNKVLPGAVFQYGEGDQAAVTMVANDETGMHTMKDGDTLNFNVLYKLHESTVPAGYDGAEDVYFKVLKKADFATQTGVAVPEALANEKVLFVKTDKDGKVTEWVKPDRDNNIFTTTFTVKNTKQAPLSSIFPVTGGTGIMGIMMLGLAFVGVAGAFTLKRKFSN